MNEVVTTFVANKPHPIMKIGFCSFKCSYLKNNCLFRSLKTIKHNIYFFL